MEIKEERTAMNERLERIAHELEHDVYKNPMHGNIAKCNFIYGVAQAEIEITDLIKNMKECFNEQNCEAIDAYAPTDKVAYLAGKRDAMTELLNLLKG